MDILCLIDIEHIAVTQFLKCLGSYRTTFQRFSFHDDFLRRIFALLRENTTFLRLHQIFSQTVAADGVCVDLFFFSLLLIVPFLIVPFLIVPFLIEFLKTGVVALELGNDLLHLPHGFHHLTVESKATQLVYGR